MKTEKIIYGVCALVTGASIAIVTKDEAVDPIARATGIAALGFAWPVTVTGFIVKAARLYLDGKKDS